MSEERVEYTVPLPDSGERIEYETGARRDTQSGKGRYDLLPWDAVTRWAIRMEQGAEKYGDRNWQQGIPLSRYFSSAVRHLVQWQAGDRNEDHLAAVLFNVGALLWTEQQIDDGNLPESLRQ